MDISPWLNGLTPEQLPEPYRTLADQFSLRTALTFASLYQGTGMYFPKLDSLLQEHRNRSIRSEFDGGNYKSLARKYGITERWVYEIVGAEIDESQTSLFFDKTLEPLQ